MIYEETTSPNQNGPNVKTIQVPDPPMCHSTGVSGTDSDLDCTATLSQLNANDIRIEVYNHVRQAMAFEQNPAVNIVGAAGHHQIPQRDAIPNHLVLVNGTLV
jgi:hypothetical protein